MRVHLSAPAAVRLLGVAWATSSTILLAACGGGDPGVPSDAPRSVAMNAWTPGPNDSCTQADHDRFATLGPDGKVYPTWHPALDPQTGCSFGHDHGRDPSGSDLYGKVGALPFGYANEQQVIYDASTIRHEDHVGHKVEWANDIDLEAGGGQFRLRCDVLTKLHQGTHSKDAFTNNLHELNYNIQCGDGSEARITVLTAIGTPGEFRESCTGNMIQAGTATPATSPNGGGVRIIPTRNCVEQIKVAEGNSSNYFELNENWEVNVFVEKQGGGRVFSANPYYQVRNASRFYDPAVHPVVGRQITACDEINTGNLKLRGDYCEDATQGGVVSGIPFDSPTSTFDGARRVVDVNNNNWNNEDGPDVWYTNPFGKAGSPDPFPGSIRQFVSRRSNDVGLDANGPVIGQNSDFGGNGVHAPN
jgi:hypothetical protein